MLFILVSQGIFWVKNTTPTYTILFSIFRLTLKNNCPLSQRMCRCNLTPTSSLQWKNNYVGYLSTHKLHPWFDIAPASMSRFPSLSWPSSGQCSQFKCWKCLVLRPMWCCALPTVPPPASASDLWAPHTVAGIEYQVNTPPLCQSAATVTDWNWAFRLGKPRGKHWVIHSGHVGCHGNVSFPQKKFVCLCQVCLCPMCFLLLTDESTLATLALAT